MTSTISVARKRRRSDVTAIALLLLAEATLFFTFVFIVGPIATRTRLIPLVVVLILCAALYWGQQYWARWALFLPIAFRVWRLVLVIAAAWGLGRPGIALFLMLIVVAELVAAFILLDRYFVSRQRLQTAGAPAAPLSQRTVGAE